MRFAVISDIHGNLAATESVLADIDQLEAPVDVVVCTGDIVGHAAHPNEVISLLKERKIELIRGNYDEAVAGARDLTGTDYAGDEEQRVDIAAVLWTREQLSAENLELVRGLPMDARVSVTRAGTDLEDHSLATCRTETRD
jgi:predicted phosphodiesterase